MNKSTRPKIGFQRVLCWWILSYKAAQPVSTANLKLRERQGEEEREKEGWEVAMGSWGVSETIQWDVLPLSSSHHHSSIMKYSKMRHDDSKNKIRMIIIIKKTSVQLLGTSKTDYSLHPRRSKTYCYYLTCDHQQWHANCLLLRAKGELCLTNK